MNILQNFGRFEFISPRRRKKVIWKLCDLLKIQHREFETEFFGMKYRGNTRNYIDQWVYFFGGYEKGMLSFIRKTLESSREKIFIDIGANIGHHSLFAAAHSKHVYAFEPYALVRKSLEEKVALNRLQNVTVVPYALGEKDEQLPYFEPPDFNQGTGSFLKEFKGHNSTTGQMLTVRNGAKLFEELGIQKASLVKIDTEGFEALVLKGLLPFLEKTMPVLIMEYSPESENFFKQNPEVREFIENNYRGEKFSDPNGTRYRLLPWNFDKFGDVILSPLRT